MQSTAAQPITILGDKIKSFERMYEKILLPSVPFIVRLDGVSFKNFTTGMVKPFDKRFAWAMQQACADTFDRFNARTAFVQSDEMTFVLPAEENVQYMPYGGRCLKIASVFASYASVRFNYYLSQCNWRRDDSKELEEKVLGGGAIFDGRVFSVPDDMSAMEAIYWRHKYDCRRNAINSIGTHILSHKEIQGLNTLDVQNKLRIEGHDLSTFDPVFLYGTFIKKSLVDHCGYNPRTNEEIWTKRGRIDMRIFDWTMDNKRRSEMVTAKYWSEGDQQSIEQPMTEREQNLAIENS